MSEDEDKNNAARFVDAVEFARSWQAAPSAASRSSITSAKS
jgi:hypothetical protein